MSDHGRKRRVGEQIKRGLGELIQREMRDPRLQWVTVTAVDVTPDFSHATIFFTVLGGTDDLESILKALDHSEGFLRTRLGKKLKMRIVPQLHFKHDTSVEHGSYMESFIDEVVAEDQSKVNQSKDHPEQSDKES